MRYWDSSALVPLLLVETSSATMDAVLGEDRSIATWWGTAIECVSALARRERAGSLDEADRAIATRKLTFLEARWSEVTPTRPLRDSACRLVRVHDLRAADALQLAAAVDLRGRGETTPPFVTLDERLALAAAREGFPVLPG